MIKIASWNVNSIKTRVEQVTNWLEEHEPDVLLLQELRHVHRVNGFDRQPVTVAVLQKLT